METYQTKGVPFLQFGTVPVPDGQYHAIFTRNGGVSQAPFASLNLSISVADEPASVSINRSRAYGVLKRTSQSVVYAHLTHDAEVRRVTAEQHGQIVERVDGLITDEPGCALTMNFADCAPIFIYDPIKRAIGLGHAGWQGAVKDLPGALVRAMVQTFGSTPAELWAGIGPCIGPCCYEVGEPVISAVRANFAAPETLLLPTEGPRPHFDLPTANRRCLERAGVLNVEMAEQCTACRTDLFFSHRAEHGRTGRFGVLFLIP